MRTRQRTGFLWLATAGSALLVVAGPASAKTLDRAVLVGADGSSIRIAGPAGHFENLARDPRSTSRGVRGGFVRLYFVGRNDFPANRARYYPGHQCIALDWPTYERSCLAVRPELAARFRRAHALRRFTERPTVLARLTYLSRGRATAGLAGLTGSIELAVGRTGESASQPSRCYALTGSLRGPAAGERPKQLFLCRSGVWANGRLHALHRVVWEWFRLNFGPP